LDNVDFWTEILRRALISGSTAGAVSTAALAVMSKLEGKGAAQPTKATSHWLYGDRAAAPARLDEVQTVIGYATNQAAAVFWAVLFETVRARRLGNDAVGTAKSAACVAAIAAVVDYGIMPRRLTPGWELALSRASVGAGFVALAAGLTLGGLLADRSSQ
jgi:hypothetical protein